MSRVLLLKFGAIGDVVMLIPAAHQLHLAGHTVDWVCGPAVLPILQLYAWINPIPADDRALLTGSRSAKLRALLALWSALRLRRYDLVATLYYDRRYRLLTLPVRAARRIALSTTHRAFRLLPGRHHTDEYARILLDRPDTLNPTPLPPVPVSSDRLPQSPLPRQSRTRILLAPAGARNLLADDALRRWPAESYVSLATLLLAQNHEVVLIGGPDDAWAQSLFAHLPVVDLIGTLTLTETLALLHSNTILVTHDTGPLHLAGITSAGIVALFGPTDPHGRLPQRRGALALWGGESFPCRPCYDGQTFAACPRNDCIRQLTPELVLSQVKRMLVGQREGTLPPPHVIAVA